MDCRTKYPVLLVHGMGARDRKWPNYWGRIPKALKSKGASLFFGNQDSNGSVEENALVVKNSLLRALNESGAEKVNIIAHSKGGLEARYLISSMGMADRIASLTTISSPHNGSATMDFVMKIPTPLMKFGCGIADLWFRILGDKKPNTYSCLKSFTTDQAREFNIQNPDDPKVFYQSYAFVMKRWNSDLFMWFPHFIVSIFEGDNDGLLAPDAVKWTNFRGVFSGAGRKGVSHCQQADLYRHKLTVNIDGRIMDITDFYAEIVDGLRIMGY